MSPFAMKRPSYLIPTALLCLILWDGVVLAADETPGVNNCPGLLYRSKKEGIPVYDSPDVTSKVLRKLELGEKVCRVGEMAQFQILRWTPHAKEEDGTVTKSATAFARSVDLWEARDMPGAKIGVIESATRFFKLLFSGGMAEDPLLPYRPIMTPEQKPNQPLHNGVQLPEESTCEQ